jgi:hypothetical protein
MRIQMREFSGERSHLQSRISSNIPNIASSRNRSNSFDIAWPIQRIRLEQAFENSMAWLDADGILGIGLRISPPTEGLLD